MTIQGESVFSEVHWSMFPPLFHFCILNFSKATRAHRTLLQSPLFDSYARYQLDAFLEIESTFAQGVDLSHVICSPTAAGPIKSYSPDLIVHPILREDALVPSHPTSTTVCRVLPFRSVESVKSELESLLSRLHVLVVGPGLGREDYMQSYAHTAISIARSRGMFIVIDADGLYMVGKDRSVIQGYRRVVITPNVVEFKRLTEQIGVSPDTPPDKKAQVLSRLLGGVTVLEKGAQDVIVTDTEGAEADLAASQLQGANPEKEKFSELVKVDISGGLKRVGGQGDVLSGSVGAFLAWGRCYEDGAFG